MNVLVACEYSGLVRDAFIAKGHRAMSCDLLPTERPGPHYQGDVRDILHYPWDLLIAFPDCTYVCGSGWHWVTRGRIEDDGRPRIAHVVEAIAFAKMLLQGKETAHIPSRAIENPVGVLSKHIRKPDQIIQPWWFGDDASKKTCLWLENLEPLQVNWNRAVYPKSACCGYKLNTNYYKGQKICPQCGKPTKFINANQTASGQNKLTPSEDRAKIRSLTYQGVADAMAEQWG